MSIEHRHYPAALPTVDISVLTPRLKKSSEQTSFVKYNIDDQYMKQLNISVQERMRIMDRFFLHNPHPEEECALLNLPNSRLHLHSLKDVMYLSGGLVGIRFEGDELKDASSLLKVLSNLWAELDKNYKSMTNNERKIIWANEVEGDGAFLKVGQFHRQCDEYLCHIKELQLLVMKKQSQIDCSCSKELPKLDTDPDSRVGSQYPVWYSILKEKYTNYLLTFKDSGDIPKFTLGKFAVFLSSCIHGPITCEPNEIAALNELQEASMDNVSIFMPEVHLASTAMTEPQRRYWAHRFFNFLKSVPELKSIVKDEKAVEMMSLW